MNVSTIDDEIVDIFVQEAREVFDNIDKHLPVWRKRPTDRNALTEIRRGFHTLKGSGRMVEALDVAEVAWKFETMLNRVLDGRIQVTESMVKLVSAARDQMPRMLDALASRRPTEADGEIEYLMAQAEALTSGQQAPARLSVVPTGDGEQGAEIKIAELERRLTRFQKHSDEALGRSEMALQQARKVASAFQAVSEGTHDRVSREEANRIIGRVNQLAQEVRELRVEAKQLELKQPPRPRETGQTVDDRVHQRMVKIERRYSQLEQQLAEAQDTAAASRTLGWWALALSALVGAGAAAAVLMSGLPLG